MSMRNALARAAAAATLATLASLAAAPAASAQQRQHATAAAAPAISADSAKTIALANVPGATVKSAKLQHRNGHATYRIRLAGAQGQPDSWATVDATTGAFAKSEHTVANGTAAGKTHKSAPKKPSGK